MHITNVDTLSALIDRLIVEHIKRFFFLKEGRADSVRHQDRVINEIRQRTSELLAECLSRGNYEFLKEQRTFPAESFIEELEGLIRHNIECGEADRAKLAELRTGAPAAARIVENELRARKATEGRAKGKNDLDELFKGLVKLGGRKRRN